MTPDEKEGMAHAMVYDANDLADDILTALKSPACHASHKPVISVKDNRDVLLDGHFDLVALARIIRDGLHREMLKLLEGR